MESNYYKISKCEPQNHDDKNVFNGPCTRGGDCIFKKNALECKVNTNKRVHIIGAHLPADSHTEMYKDK